ncbi:MAG: hypothetical protein K5790_06250 [Nitrosopumilus sp.]|uniref:hypothetical protein n=1 Tax=Nitrosopumilus sp. TaxID=2024843 RepID=UPI00247CA16F|nr:hypothetical protein [Nitrosopumilus sp.]MCV0392882.1 hypothetical protein [Nitrosopumilus sp.]
MRKIIFNIFLILLLIPFTQGFSQEYYDNAPTLSVALSNETPFVYQDAEGYTVVIGMVENHDSLSAVDNVRIQVTFYDDIDPAPIDISIGGTILESIPPNGKSPYSIRSTSPNSEITQASVTLLGFDSSEGKQKGLLVYPTDVFYDASLRLSGVLENGGAPNSNTNVYAVFYDSFEPPRYLQISTIELGNVASNAEISFELDENIDARAVGFLLFAESDVFYSDFVDVKIPPPQSLTKLVKISDVSVKDTSGNKLSEITLGSTVNIESQTWVQFSLKQNSNETPYTYYVQIKESGESPYVEFIGKYDGRFIGTGLQTQTIDWIPEKPGLFFIETFVWDRNNIPIAEQGPFVLVIVK